MTQNNMQAHNEASTDAYQILLDRHREAPWQSWPAPMRAVLPEMARDRAAHGQPVWFPPILYIEPTNACNAHCSFCPRKAMTRKTGFMDFALYEHIIQQAAALGPSEIRLFHYGEPLLHPQLPDMVRCAKARGLDARFQTNGLHLTRERIEALLESGMSYIGVSVNGLDRREYETIRPGHSYDTLLANIACLRKTIEASGRHCHMHINAHVEHREIRERDEDVRAFARTWLPWADTLSISGINHYDQAGALSVHSDQHAPRHQPSARRSDHEVCCREPFDRLVIKWDGRVSPCCVDFDARLTVGDLRRDSLEHVWNGGALASVQHHVGTRTYAEIPLCRTCPKFFSEPYNLVVTAPPPGSNGQKNEPEADTS